ncbi:MAG: adenylyl-sulfate kinase [Oscillospiraceae bacterium]
MNFIDVSELNALSGRPEELIYDGERFYREQIEKAALSIYEQRVERPVVLISGPSGSGKTTTAARIQHILKEKGAATHTVSMDNYYLPMHENLAAMDENGNIDFESPMRLDIPLFRSQLEQLLDGGEINVPLFDFAAQQRREGMNLRCEKGDIVIIEGIHALNPLLTGDTDDSTSCVYVSVRTRICSRGEQLHPSKIRLMRRLMRDKLYRGRSLEETFEFFRSVERGEGLYIMPYKHRADYEIDTFIMYEPMVYRDILLPELERSSREYTAYSDYADIEKFLRMLEPLDKRLVPDNSLIREFIG